MKIIMMLLAILTIAACEIKVGEFTPERHRLHDLGRPDCEKTPEKCVDGVPW